MEVPRQLYGHCDLFDTLPRLPGVNENQESNVSYERYWQHYKMMQEWMEQYVTAWKDKRNVYAPKMTHRRKITKKFQTKAKRQNMGNSSAYRNSISSHHQISTASETMSVDQQGSGEDSSQEADFDVEVSEEFREFFVQSQKHRDAREKRKEDAVREMEEDGKESSKHNTEAPKERPGSRRNEEMKILYGKYTPMIQGLETAVQMEFDHILDRKQPPLWPSIALNL